MRQTHNRVSQRLVIAAMLATGAFACERGQTTAASKTQSIATDLPDSGGADMPVELYWVTATEVFRARCANRDVLLPSQCTDAMQSMPYEQFKKTLDGGLSDTIRELQDEARTIQISVTNVSDQINQTLAQIDQIEAQQGGLSDQLKTLRAQMQNFQTIVQEYQQQLTLIDQSLQKAVDQDMSQLRQYVVDQLSNYQTQLAALAGQVQTLASELDTGEEQVATLKTQIDQLNVRLTNLDAELSGVQGRLQSAYDDFSVYQSTLDQLLSGIVHPILSDNVWWEKQRQFVKRFDQVFTPS